MVEVASANVVALARAKESVYGVGSTTGADYKKMRYTGESLAQEQQTVASNEINEDRQTSDLIRTDLGAAGSINFEFSHETYDPELIMLFHEDTGDWVIPGTATAVVTSSTITGGNNFSGDFSAIAGETGKFVEVVVRAAGPGAIEERKAARLVSVTGTASALFDMFGTPFTNVVGKHVTVTVGKMITNGTLRQSYTYERHFKDAEGGSGNRAYNYGYTANNMNLSISAAAIVTGSFDFVGAREEGAIGAIWTGSQVAATTTKVMNGVDSIEAFLEGGAAFRLLRGDITIGNNITAHKAVSVLGALELTSGQLAVSGTVQAYFKTKAQFDKFLQFTDTNFVITFRDQNNKLYVLHIPDVKFTAGKRNAAGINQAVIAELSFGAIKDPTLGKTMRLFSIVSA